MANSFNYREAIAPSLVCCAWNRIFNKVAWQLGIVSPDNQVNYPCVLVKLAGLGRDLLFVHIPSPDDLLVTFNRLTRMRFRIFPTSEETGKRDRLAELVEQAPVL